MAPTLVQRTKYNSAGLGTGSDGFVGSISFATDQAVAASNYFVLAITISGASGNVSGVTDTRGNTWSKWTATVADSYSDGDPDSNIRVEIWTAASNGAGANTITINNTGGTAVQWGVFFSEYSGLTATPRGSTGTAIESGYVQAHSVATSTSVTKDDLVVAVYANSHTNEAFTVGNGYGNLATTGSATGLQYLSAAIEGRIASNAGTQSASFGTTGYDKGVLSIFTLHPNVTTAPPPPTDVTATPGNASVTSSWSPSPSATSYKVYRGTASTGPFTLQQSGITDTFYTQSSLTNGTTYWYTVSAVNGVGESAQTAAPSATPFVPQAPPFLTWYANGSQPSLTALSMRQTWAAKMDSWLGYTLTSEYTPGTAIPQLARYPGPVKRIKAPDQGFYSSWDSNWPNKRNGTVSEGIGYAALACAWRSNSQLETGVYSATAKANADALLRFYLSWLDDRYLMHWHIFEQGVAADFNGATDGDEDVAEAFRVMSELHGDGGVINYGLEAERIMAAIQDYEVNPETGVAYPNALLAGDGWGSVDILMPDYFRAGYFKEWATWLRKRGKTARADRWDRIYTANYDLLDFYINASGNAWSAGVPDRQTRAHTTFGGDNNNNLVTYNSVRLGFGLMTDVLWHGSSADPRALSYMNRIANRFKAVYTTGSNVKAPPYTNDLSSGAGFSNATGYAYVGSTALGSSGNQTFATELFNALGASTEYNSSYFNGGLGVYALGIMSGAAQPFTTTAPAPGDPPPPPSVTPSSRTVERNYWDGSKWVLELVKSSA